MALPASNAPTATEPAPGADWILSPRMLLPIAPDNVVREDVSVALRGTHIVALGPPDELLARHPDARHLPLPDHLLMPGLVNAHGHLAMTLLRGLGEGQPLKTWLEDTVWPLEARWVGPAFVRDGTRLAVAEMLASGTTAAADMYYFPDEAAEICQAAGFRLQVAFPIVELRNAYASGADECFAKGLALHDRVRGEDLVTTCFGPHSGYAVQRKSLERVAMLADELDIGVQTHLHETAEEVADARRKTGVTWLRLLDGIGLLNESLQAVHMTAVTDDDIALVAERGARVVHCPHSNMKLASGACPVPRFSAAGVRVGLGTDGAASNNSLDMFAEARLAALLAKHAGGDPTALGAAQTLALATIGGARALGLEHKVGSVEVGKQADLIAIDLRHPSMQPLHDAQAQLVHSGAGPRVTHTFVAGRLLYENGAYHTLDIDETLRQADQWRRELQT